MNKAWNKAAAGEVRRPDSPAISFAMMTAVVISLALLLAGAVHGSARAESTFSLPEAIRLSLEHSSKIQSVEQDSIAAEYAYREAKSSRFPTISLNATSFYIDDLQAINVPPMKLEIGSHENVQLDCKISIPLWTGGRISNRIRIGKANARMQASNLAAEKLQTAYASRSAYFHLLAAQAIVRSAGSSLKRIEILKRDIENRFANGVADSLDILEVELALQEAKETLAEKATMKRNASAALARLLGLPLQEPITLPKTVPEPADPAGREVPADRIERPELDAFDSRIRASEMLVRLNQAGYFPTLSAYGGYSAGKPNRDMFNKTWNDYFSAGLALTWEFNTGGGAGYAAKSARSQYYAAKTAKKDYEENLRLQAAISLENLKYAFERYTITKSKYNIAARKFRLAGEKHKAGKISVNRLLELEAELAAVEQMVHASISDYYLSETEFLYVTGSQKIYGGF